MSASFMPDVQREQRRALDGWACGIGLRHDTSLHLGGSIYRLSVIDGCRRRAMMKPACAFEFLNHWSISLTFKTITQLGATLKEPSSADTICSPVQLDARQLVRHEGSRCCSFDKGIGRNSFDGWQNLQVMK